MKLVCGDAGVVKRVVGLQRDVDRAVVALGHQVKTMVEELAEQREPGIVGSGQALIGRDVRQHDARPAHLDAMLFEHRIKIGLGQGMGGDETGIALRIVCASWISVMIGAKPESGTPA